MSTNSGQTPLPRSPRKGWRDFPLSKQEISKLDFLFSSTIGNDEVNLDNELTVHLAVQKLITKLGETEEKFSTLTHEYRNNLCQKYRGLYTYVERKIKAKLFARPTNRSALIETESDDEASTRAGKQTPSFDSLKKEGTNKPIIIDTAMPPRDPQDLLSIHTPPPEEYEMQNGVSVLAARHRYTPIFEKIARDHHALLDTIADCKKKIKQTQMVLVGFKRTLRQAKKQLAAGMNSDSDLSAHESDEESLETKIAKYSKQN